MPTQPLLLHIDLPLLLHEHQVLSPGPQTDRPVLPAGVQASGVRTQAQAPHTAAVTREHQNLLEPGEVVEVVVEVEPGATAAVQQTCTQLIIVPDQSRPLCSS